MYFAVFGCIFNLMVKEVVVFIFYDSQKKKYLIEKRVSGQLYGGMKIFPGGRVEDNEIGNLEKTLFREIKEELGVSPIDYIDLKYPVDAGNGWTLYPFLVTSWKGKISERILDKGGVLEWIDRDKYIPKLDTMTKILEKVNEYVAHS